jgi:hypothetical protein
MIRLMPLNSHSSQKLRSFSFFQIHDPHTSHNTNEIFFLAVLLMHGCPIQYLISLSLIIQLGNKALKHSKVTCFRKWMNLLSFRPLKNKITKFVKSQFMQGAAYCRESICKSKAWPNVEALFEITSLIPKQNLPCTRRPEARGDECG